MKRLLIVSAAVALAHGGHSGLSGSHYGNAIAVPTRVSYGAPAPVSYAAPAPVSYGSQAPAAYGAQAYSSQPLYLSSGNIAGSSGGGFGTGGGSFAYSGKPRLHEIHTHSGRQLIRLEEYHGPNQIIRVHEQPQGPPQIIKVAAPAEAPSLIRVVSKSSGRAHVERIVHRAPGPQVFDIKKPARAPARIVQVVRAPAPAPRLEFIQESGEDHHVYVAQAPAPVPLPPAGAGLGFSADEFEASEVGPYGGHSHTAHHGSSASEVHHHHQHEHASQEAEELYDGSGVVEPRAIHPVQTRTVESSGW